MVVNGINSKQMKNIRYIYILISFVVMSCSDNLSQKTGLLTLHQFQAELGDLVMSRSHLEDGRQVIWDEGDQIGVFSDVQETVIPFDFKNYTTEGGLFDGEEVEGNVFYACYPYSGEHNGSIVQMALSPVFSYQPNSYSRQCPMVAQSSGNKLLFKQTCGIIRLSLKGKMRIVEIELKGNNGELLAGTGAIDISESDPEFKISECASDISKNIIMTGFNVELSDDSVTDFYFIVPVITFSKGLTFTLSGWDNSTGVEQHRIITKRTDKVIKISRAVIKSFAAVDTDDLVQEEPQSLREIFMALYNATNGKHWKNNEGWGSDLPVSEWYGVYVRGDGAYRLALEDNNLSGYIPTDICHLPLYQLNLSNNKLSGSIPEEIGLLNKLVSLNLSYNQLVGEIPNGLKDLDALKTLYLQNNNLSGEIPHDIGMMPNLQTLSLRYNDFSTTTLKTDTTDFNRLSRLLVCLPQNNNSFRLFIDSNNDKTENIRPDGTFEMIQQSDHKSAVDLIIIGEGFDDLENSVGGTAEYWMRRVANNYFLIDPLHKMKKYFNVYLLYVHSTEKGVSFGDDYRNSKFKYLQTKYNSSMASINMASCYDYIKDKIGFNDERLKKAHVVVVVNSCHNALSGGICLYYPSFRLDAAMTSMALIPIRASSFEELLWHESIGHGIGLLADEYGGADSGAPNSVDANANVDFIGDPAKIKWSQFIEDRTHYSGDDEVGVFEGGKGFNKGVFRPTEKSIMNSGMLRVLRFNPPSRKAIYDRIMSVLNDDLNWCSTYEDFRDFDLKE